MAGLLMPGRLLLAKGGLYMEMDGTIVYTLIEVVVYLLAAVALVWVPLQLGRIAQALDRVGKALEKR